MPSVPPASAADSGICRGKAGNRIALLMDEGGEGGVRIHLNAQQAGGGRYAAAAVV